MPFFSNDSKKNNQEPHWLNQPNAYPLWPDDVFKDIANLSPDIHTISTLRLLNVGDNSPFSMMFIGLFQLTNNRRLMTVMVVPKYTMHQRASNLLSHHQTHRQHHNNPTERSIFYATSEQGFDDISSFINAIHQISPLSLSQRLAITYLNTLSKASKLIGHPSKLERVWEQSPYLERSELFKAALNNKDDKTARHMLRQLLHHPKSQWTEHPEDLMHECLRAGIDIKKIISAWPYYLSSIRIEKSVKQPVKPILMSHKQPVPNKIQIKLCTESQSLYSTITTAKHTPDFIIKLMSPDMKRILQRSYHQTLVDYWLVKDKCIAITLIEKLDKKHTFFHIHHQWLDDSVSCSFKDMMIHNITIAWSKLNYKKPCMVILPKQNKDMIPETITSTQSKSHFGYALDDAGFRVIRLYLKSSYDISSLFHKELTLALNELIHPRQNNDTALVAKL